MWRVGVVVGWTASIKVLLILLGSRYMMYGRDVMGGLTPEYV